MGTTTNLAVSPSPSREVRNRVGEQPKRWSVVPGACLPDRSDSICLLWSTAVRKIDAAAVRARAKAAGQGASAEAELRPNSSSLLDVTQVKHRAIETDPVVIKTKREVRYDCFAGHR